MTPAIMTQLQALKGGGGVRVVEGAEVAALCEVVEGKEGGAAAAMG